MAGNSGPVQPIVIGAKTRLAQELIRQLLAESPKWHTPLILARSADEQQKFAKDFSDCEVRQFHQVGTEPAGKRIAIFCCALGPIHPSDQPDTSTDMQAVEKELASLRSLVELLQPATIHVVFVSTVLAVSSGLDRYYYSGWKRWIDSAISSWATAIPSLHVSVVYPGRLIEAKATGQPRTWFSTRYSRVARIVLRAAEQNPSRRIIGMDSRLLLVNRAIATLWSALAGKAR